MLQHPCVYHLLAGFSEQNMIDDVVGTSSHHGKAWLDIERFRECDNPLSSTAQEARCSVHHTLSMLVEVLTHP